MLTYLRESLHWIYLVVCKPLTLQEKVRHLSKKEQVAILLKLHLLLAVICIFLISSLGLGITTNEHHIGWRVVLRGSAISLFAGLWLGGGWIWFRNAFHIGLTCGLLGFSVSFGVGLPIGAVFGEVYGISFIFISTGVFFGLTAAFIVNQGRVSKLTLNLISMGLGLSLLGACIWKYGLVVKAVVVGLPPTLAYFFFYFRVFYLLPYILQYSRSGKALEPFPFFHHSPIYWDEAIAFPLPHLKDWLVNLVKRDRQRGLEEIVFVAEHCPFQREAALRALLDAAEERLHRVHDLNGLAEIPNLLEAFPDKDNASPKGINDAGRRLNTISTLARDYQSRLTVVGQLKVLEELCRELESFRIVMKLTVAPVGTIFQPLATRWLEMVKQAEDETNKRLQFTSLPNLYVAGAPLQERDFGLLKGRRDIIRAIEKDVLNADQRPALLLYGRRRTGKSSTLLNLPRLLSSQFEPVYIDCQDAKWHESDQAFCCNLAREIFERLFQSDDVKGIRQPQEAQFEKNAFTRLDEYLDQFERLATERGKRILLTFDEYEGLEESIAGGDISKNVLGKLRNIIQHRARIVVLVSGSHRFEELTGVNWASYLINTRTLELSFLDEASARELLTEPVPQLRYEGEVLEEILRLTRCQPYLLQAVASELVNHLNELQKTTATRADLDAAVNKVLTSAGAYFANTWREDNSATEQTVLRAYAEGAGERVAAAEFQSALQSLIRKEMMERDGDGYRLAVPLFGLWILRNQVD